MTVLGMDVGYGWTKVVDEKGVRTIPSVVGSWEPTVQVPGFGADRQNGVVTIGRQRYLVGERALRHSAFLYQTQARGWIDSVAYRALVAEALVSYGPEEPLTVATGLPVRHLDDRQALAKVIRQCHPGIQTVEVLPQPLGTFMDLYLSEQGEVVRPELAEQVLGIIDIGFFTSDFLTLDRLQMQGAKMQGVDVGMSMVGERLARDIGEAFRLPLNSHQADEVIRTRQVRVYGEAQDVGELVDARVKELAQVIRSQAERLWHLPALDGLILTGGGAALVAPELTALGPVRAVADSQAANARGYFRYARYAGRVAAA